MSTNHFTVTAPSLPESVPPPESPSASLPESRLVPTLGDTDSPRPPRALADPWLLAIYLAATLLLVAIGWTYWR